MMQKINFIALAAAISTLVLVAISLFVPWWQLTAMNPANVQVNFSPVNLNLIVSGSAVSIPTSFSAKHILLTYHVGRQSNTSNLCIKT